MAGKKGKFEDGVNRLLEVVRKDVAVSGYCDLTTKSLARRIGRSPRQTEKYLRTLMKNGRLFCRVSRSRYATIRTLFFPVGFDDPEAISAARFRFVECLLSRLPQFDEQSLREKAQEACGRAWDAIPLEQKRAMAQSRVGRTDGPASIGRETGWLLAEEYVEQHEGESLFGLA